MFFQIFPGPDILDYTVRTGGSVETLSSGMIAGIVVGSVVVLVAIVGVVIYFLYAYRRKKDEKEAYNHSMSTLLPSGTVMFELHYVPLVADAYGLLLACAKSFRLLQLQTSVGVCLRCSCCSCYSFDVRANPVGPIQYS